MNLFSKLPLLKNLGSDTTQEDEEAAAKKARIKFHREHVRNGPVKSRPVTNGQIRRAEVRRAKTTGRKAFEQQKRAFFASQHEIALLRVHLQRVGVLPWGSPTTQSTVHQIAASITWIAENFPAAKDEVNPHWLQSSIQQAFDRYAALVGLPEQKVELNPEIFAA